MKTQFARTGIKAKKAVFRERLFFVRAQSDDISIKRGYSLHVFDKEYDAAQIHGTAPMHGIVNILQKITKKVNIKTERSALDQETEATKQRNVSDLKRNLAELSRGSRDTEIAQPACPLSNGEKNTTRRAFLPLDFWGGKLKTGGGFTPILPV